MIIIFIQLVDVCVSREHEQKVKAQLGPTYDLVQKSPSANTAAVEASCQHVVQCQGHYVGTGCDLPAVPGTVCRLNNPLWPSWLVVAQLRFHLQEWENGGSTEDVEAGRSGGPADQLPRNALHPSTITNMKKSEGKERWVSVSDWSRPHLIMVCL